jgi:hypothetical protein
MAAVDSVGLLPESAFRDTTISRADLESIRSSLDSSNHFTLPDGAEAVLRAGSPYVVGVERQTGFAVLAHSRDNALILVHVFAPLVNGDSNQGALMMRSIHAVAMTLSPSDATLPAWIDSSAWSVWRGWEQARTRADNYRKRRSGDYQMTVTGVPPDFVLFGALRRDAVAAAMPPN